MTDRELYMLALEASRGAYAPYSNYHVGAALLCADGRIFTGINIENASYGATNCAERTAIFKAISEGCRSFTAIAVASPDGDSSPCGVCRQVMNEFSPEMKVIFGRDAEHIEAYTAAELLPRGFAL